MMVCVNAIIIIMVSCCSIICSATLQYRTNQEIFEHMRTVSALYPNISHLYSIGRSVGGTEMMVLAIGAVHPDKHVLLRPEGKYIGNMHGNEAGSREVLVNFMDFLVENFPGDEEVKSLLESSRIHIMPTMNPDGFDQSREGDCSSGLGRYNIDGHNLNRIFPDIYHGPPDISVPEVAHVIDWMDNNQFVLSANFHSGSVVVNYPYDSYPESDKYSMPSICPDDDTFQHLAKQYSFNHRSLIGTTCSFDNSVFKDGITNGADWYIATGTMQDYNYVFAGCMEVTVELTCCKYPEASTLQQQWLDNKDALVAYLSNIDKGVKGIVFSNDSQPIRNARVTVDERQHVKTTPLGEYWKILLPGHYTLKIELGSTIVYTSDFEVKSNITTIYNITLPHSSEYYTLLTGSARYNLLRLPLLYFTVFTSVILL